MSQKIQPIRLCSTRATISAPTVAERERGDREHHAAVAAEPEVVRRRLVAEAEHEQDERGERIATMAPQATHALIVPLLSHSDTCAGCTVSPTTLTQLALQRVEVELVAQPRRRSASSVRAAS